MDRRSFVKAGVAASLASTIEAKAQPAAKKKPNILYVFGDQHRAQSLPGEDSTAVIAPTLEAFRKQNLSMDRCVSNYPLCTPYRGILMSGRWPSQSGLIYNNIPLSPREVTVTDTFQKAGYHTGYVGKWHLAGHGEDPGFIPKGPRRMGIEDWQIWDSTNLHFKAWTYNQETGEKIMPPGWQPIAMTDEAVKFVQEQPKENPDKPWILFLSWNPPHPPYNPPPEDANLYPADKLKFRPNVVLRPDEQDQQGTQQWLVSDAKLRSAMQGYYGAITGIDKEFAKLLKALDDTGQADNTIVIFTSDHGEMMGSHGRMQKQVPFEESCRVPFMIRYPGVTPKAAKSDALFAAVDIYPTLCGLAGIPVPEHCVGRDHSPMMRGEKMQESEMVFLLNQVATEGAGAKGPAAEGAGEHQMWVNMPSYRGVRTKTHTYAVALSGRWLLFDNIADPYQMKNLIDDPTQKPLTDKLDAAIMAWMKKAGDEDFPYKDAMKKVSNFPS